MSHAYKNYLNPVKFKLAGVVPDCGYSVRGDRGSGHTANQASLCSHIINVTSASYVVFLVVVGLVWHHYLLRITV